MSHFDIEFVNIFKRKFAASALKSDEIETISLSSISNAKLMRSSTVFRLLKKILDAVILLNLC